MKAIKLEDLKEMDPKELVRLWKAATKLVPEKEREKWAEKEMRLRGREKKLMKERIMDWIEECQLDYYVDEEQMWKDHIVVRCHSSDGLPMEVANMLTGWEVFVFGTEMLSEEELKSFHHHLNGKEE
jgi:hypothetical protein